MDENRSSNPLFRRIDQYVFDQIDRFKLSPNYASLQDFYNGLEEEQQKIFKVLSVIGLALLPALLLMTMWWQLSALRADYEVRAAILATGNEIISQRQGVREVGPAILSQNPIDSNSMMTTRISNVLGASGVDLSKLQVGEFSSSMISETVNRADADIRFTNLSTDELVNVFKGLIGREKFRIESVEVNRSSDTNLLSGQFHAIHFSTVSTPLEDND
jgi:hypothetical protein